jgi:hypothetical protein
MISSNKREMIQPRIVYILHLLTGLAVCQGIAVFHLYHFNSVLMAKAVHALETSTNFIPSIQVLNNAGKPASILIGSAFITISIGSSITLLSILFVKLSRSSRQTHKVLFWFFLFTWLLFLINLNWNGISILASTYFIAIPLAIRILDRKLPLADPKPDSVRFKAFPVVVYFILIASWIVPFSKTTWTNFRDLVLLTSPIGTTLNEIYYNYSFAAGALFASHQMKPVKTYFLKQNPLNTQTELIEQQLQQFSHVPVSNPSHADLIVEFSGDHLILNSQSSKRLEIQISEAQTKTREVLQHFSNLSDRYRLLRLFTYYSLIIAFPTTCYILVHAILMMACRFILSEKKALLITGFIILISCSIILITVHSVETILVSKSNLKIFLTSNRTRDKLAAFHFISKHELDITLLDLDTALQSSQIIPERIWFANLLSHSADSGSVAILTEMISDPVNNVQCQAMLALGKRREKPVQKKISSLMLSTSSWYLQNCAFRALLKMK